MEGGRSAGLLRRNVSCTILLADDGTRARGGSGAWVPAFGPGKARLDMQIRAKAVIITTGKSVVALEVKLLEHLTTSG